MVLIIAAVPLETSLLRKALTAVEISRCGTIDVFSGQLRGANLVLAHCGIGQVNMAMQLTRLLDSYTPSAVYLCGCGGSYPASGLKNGDVVLAEKEMFADFGVATAEQFIPLEQLGIPQQLQLTPAVRQTLDLDSALLEKACQILPEATRGTFATVNSCSGHPALSLELERRSGAICENMEGAAAARVCENFAVPLLELRGISNPTGTRDPQQWDIAAGVNAAQRAILRLLEAQIDD